MHDLNARQPTMHDIGIAQNDDRNLRRQLAKDYWYSAAKRWHMAGTALAIVFALVAPVVLLFAPSLGPLLGAIAGVWIFASRLVVEPLKSRLQHRGAAAQELFDCDVLGLPWNPALSEEPSPEEIRKASKRLAKQEIAAKHRDWYPAEVALGWPQSVITCQRSNAVWARRQHHAYSVFLICAASLWVVVGVVVAIWHEASLAEYLTTIALPALPALLDATEMSAQHRQSSVSRRVLEVECNRLMSAADLPASALREVQDQLFGLRRSAPLVPAWFYSLLAKDYEEDMKYAAGQQARREGPVDADG